MNVINIEHISKIHGEKVIFDDVSFGIQEGDKIGIVGINGTGKSTLLKIVSGEEESDSGNVVIQNGLKIAVLSQMPVFPENGTVFDYVSAAKTENIWVEDHDAAAMLNSLGITDQSQPIRELSGGQKKRAALAKTLLTPADVLILDEPTNHLDQHMIEWLEDYLRRFRGEVLMVTHDRYFLDRVSNRILEISRGQLYSFDCNYSRFLERKAEREEMALASERKRQSILRMELEWAARGCRARSTKQRARLERLEALKNGKTPVSESSVQMESGHTRMGKKTVELHHITKRYENRTLISDFDYIFLRDQKVGFIGENGCGKSTLMKIIAGLVAPDEGSVEMGETIRLSYFAQDVPDMDGRDRVIDYIRETAEYIETKDGKISASMMLERFLFDSAMQYTPVSKLSGGEKRRLYLLRTLMEAPNVLVLDEPGNDLDIPTLTILEDYLNSFSGIVICVSHDRYFLDNVVDRIFAFEGEGRLVQYEGGFSDYKAASGGERLSQSGGEGLSAPEKKTENALGAAESSGENAKKSWKMADTRLKFSFKEQREYDTIDEDIAKLEAQIEALDEKIAENATNSLKLQELVKEKEEKERQLDEKMDRWVYLNDLAEKIEAQKS